MIQCEFCGEEIDLRDVKYMPANDPGGERVVQCPHCHQVVPTGMFMHPALEAGYESIWG